MNVYILKQIVTHNQKVDFSKRTLQEQLSSIISEVEELDNALLYAETHNTTEAFEEVTQENIDVIQTAIQSLRILELQYGVNLEDAFSKHNRKLIQERDGSIDTILYVSCANTTE